MAKYNCIFKKKLKKQYNQYKIIKFNIKNKRYKISEILDSNNFINFLFTKELY